MTHSIRRNILKLYLYSAFEMMLFAMPILLPFYLSIGLSNGDVFIVQAVFIIFAGIFEVPAGYLADKIGRKKTLIIGAAVGVIGGLLYGGAHTFAEVIFAEALLGTALSLRSGVRQAVIYDSLILLEEENTYQRSEGVAGAIGLTSEGIASILGGLMAVISLRMPFYAEAVAYTISLCIALTFDEPKRELPKRNNLENFKKVFHGIWWRDRRVFWLTLLSGIISASTFTAVWFMQIYFQNIHLDIIWFGIVYALGSFIAAFGNYISHHVQRRHSELAQFLLIIALALVGFLGMAYVNAWWGLVFVFLPRLAWGLLTPLSLNIMNRMISSDLRVTVLSLKSMIQSLMFVVLAPLYGYLTNVYSFGVATLASTGILLVFAGITLAKSYRAGALNAHPHITL